MTIEDIRRLRPQIHEIAMRHGAGSLRIFGSVANGTADERSDVDFLVDLQPGRSLIDLGGLAVDLESLLGVRVDVATPAGLKPRIRARVLEEAVPL